MRITHRDEHSLVLKGVPGGAGSLLGAAALGATLCSVVGWIAWRQFATSGLGTSHIGLGVGFLLGVAFVSLGVGGLLGRESLVLDRAGSKGSYRRRSPVGEAGPRRLAFDLADVDSVSIEVRTERSHGSVRSQGPREYEVCRARLRLRRPRRAIVLEESGVGSEARVRELAGQVAEFLGADIVDLASEEGPGERSRATDARRKVIESGGPLDLSLPEQPASGWYVIAVDPAAPEITLSSRRSPLPGGVLLVLLFLCLFELVAIAFAIGAWMPGAQWSGGPMPPGARVGLTVPALLLGGVLAIGFSMYFRGREVLAIRPEGLSREVVYPGRNLLASLPCVGSRMPGVRRTLTLDAIDSIKSVKRGGARIVEVRAAGTRWRLEPFLGSDEADKAHCDWLAESLRRSVRILSG